MRERYETHRRRLRAALPCVLLAAGCVSFEEPLAASLPTEAPMGRADAADPAVDRHRTVLGYAVRCEDGESSCVLSRIEDPAGRPLPEPETVAEGDLDAVQDALVARLKTEHGEGKGNLAVWSLGGRQFWADVFVHGGWRIQEHVLTDHYRLLDPEDTRVAWGTYAACRTRFEAERSAGRVSPPRPHWVILVHGIFRSRETMAPLEAALREAGFEPVGVNYPSTRRSVDEHAKQLEQLLASAEGVERVSFVAHSMGGLVTRRLLARSGPWRERIPVERVVMLGTPNQGSVIAETLDDFVPFHWVAGPATDDLTSEGVAALPPPDVPFAIIAGGRGDTEGFSALLPGDDDGIVLVESTHLEGAEGHLVVEALHRHLMRHPDAVAATIRFLGGGPLVPAAGD